MEDRKGHFCRKWRRRSFGRFLRPFPIDSCVGGGEKAKRSANEKAARKDLPTFFSLPWIFRIRIETNNFRKSFLIIWKVSLLLLHPYKGWREPLSSDPPDWQPAEARERRRNDCRQIFTLIEECDRKSNFGKLFSWYARSLDNDRCGWFCGRKEGNELSLFNWIEVLCNHNNRKRVHRIAIRSIFLLFIAKLFGNIICRKLMSCRVHTLVGYVTLAQTPSLATNQKKTLDKSRCDQTHAKKIILQSCIFQRPLHT